MVHSTCTAYTQVRIRLQQVRVPSINAPVTLPRSCIRVVVERRRERPPSWQRRTKQHLGAASFADRPLSLGRRALSLVARSSAISRCVRRSLTWSEQKSRHATAQRRISFPRSTLLCFSLPRTAWLTRPQSGFLVSVIGALFRPLEKYSHPIITLPVRRCNLHFLTQNVWILSPWI